MYRVKKERVNLKIFGLLCIMTVLSGCDACNEVTERKLSPSGRYEILTETEDCGATTSYTTRAYIVESGENISMFEKPLLVMDKYDKIEIDWASNNSVIVYYDKGRIHKFQNKWTEVKDGMVKNEIELVLKKR